MFIDKHIFVCLVYGRRPTTLTCEKIFASSKYGFTGLGLKN